MDVMWFVIFILDLFFIKDYNHFITKHFEANLFTMKERNCLCIIQP